MKKINLAQVAALLLLGGAGGTLGTMATAVVSYDAHARDMKTLAASSGQLDLVVHAVPPNPAAITAATEQVNFDVAQAVISFQSVDQSAKDAWNKAQPKR